jgi:quinol monooxygenase YgiN
MSFHFLVRFDPLPAKAAEFREELLRVVGLTRAERGCLSIRAFESVREPIAFGIYSEWVDEAAFDLHAKMPHTARFIAAAEQLLGRPVEGLRSHPIGGGPGAGAAGR